MSTERNTEKNRVQRVSKKAGGVDPRKSQRGSKTQGSMRKVSGEMRQRVSKQGGDEHREEQQRGN